MTLCAWSDATLFDINCKMAADSLFYISDCQVPTSFGLHVPKRTLNLFRALQQPTKPNLWFNGLKNGYSFAFSFLPLLLSYKSSPTTSRHLTRGRLPWMALVEVAKRISETRKVQFSSRVSRGNSSGQDLWSSRAEILHNSGPKQMPLC